MTKNHRNFGKGSHGGRWSGKLWSGGRGSGGQLRWSVVLSKMQCGVRFLAENVHHQCCRIALLQGQVLCRDCAFGLGCAPGVCTRGWFLDNRLAVYKNCCKLLVVKVWAVPLVQASNLLGFRASAQ